MKYRPVLLAILDGWGAGSGGDSDAVSQARTPNMDAFRREYPYTLLAAHGEAVGLPEGQMGNSEVGHLNIGAGRVEYQDFTRINKAIREGTLAENPALVAAMDASRGAALHLMGLASDGGVHSHLDHLYALLEMAAARGLERVYVHAFTDGRDTPPDSGLAYVKQMRERMAAIGCGRIATVCGRYYAMDRDNRWDRVELAWKALVAGQGNTAADPVEAVENAYAAGETDEFIRPCVITEDGAPVALVNDGDAVIFFNFRADRARQLTRAFTEEGFSGFPVADRPALASFVTMTEYESDFDLPVAFPPLELRRILGEEVSRAGLRQLRIAETEKYAHVTFFFNGGSEEPFPGEDRVLVPSPREVATYDKKPEMSAAEVTDELLRRLDSGVYDLVVLNFANGDMVGHSGIMEAAVAACEAVDACLGRIAAKIRELGGVMLVTADHGNAEQMRDADGSPFTAHTTNPVPFIVVGDALKGKKPASGGALKDIAPTVLTLLGLEIPGEMEGRSLLADG